MKICHASIVFAPLRMRKHLLAALCILTCFYSVACDQSSPEPQATVSADTYFPIQIGDRLLQVQLAVTEAEQQRGLMFRKELDADSGMLFIFPAPAQRAFWMKNTPIPLDIGYFDSQGKLTEIRALFPYDETSVPSASKNILIAVETNRGWFKANQIRPGAQLDFEALKAALKQRGFNNERLN